MSKGSVLAARSAPITSPPRIGFLGVGWIGRHRMQALVANAGIEAAGLKAHVLTSPHLVRYAERIRVAGQLLTDEAGRRVTIPDHPQHVICLTPSVTDTVYAIGAGDAVVAISDYTKYPKEALAKPSVGDLIHPSIERIVALHPDLVIGSAPNDRPPGRTPV